MMLVLVVFAAGWSFAQTNPDVKPGTNTETMPIRDIETAPAAAGAQDAASEEAPEPPKPPQRVIPKNVITIDTMPTIYTLLYSVWGKLLEIAESPISYSSFGIGAQYERQLLEKVSVTGRFAYMGFGAGLKEKDFDLGMNLFSFSTEAHARYYLLDVLFLDGMLGYANLTAAFQGTEEVRVNDIKTGITKPVTYSATRNYLKVGALLGARVINKFKPGQKVGFAFESSVGFYYGGIGFGDTMGERLSKEFDSDMTGVDGLFALLERVIFIGGPRWTLGLGLAF
jgi:hypothetical protein